MLQKRNWNQTFQYTSSLTSYSIFDIWCHVLTSDATSWKVGFSNICVETFFVTCPKFMITNYELLNKSTEFRPMKRQQLKNINIEFFLKKSMWI